MFDREEEWRILENAYYSDKAELIIVYGRRRLGKTTLVKEFLKKYGGVYIFTPRGDISDVLEFFSDSIIQQLGEFVRFGSFKDFLEYLRVKSSNQRFLVVIDEFQRLYEAYKPSISMLQHYWDSFLRNSKIMLILVGSAVGVINRLVLAGDAPLFGRRTREIRIRELPYAITRRYWKKFSESEKIECYGFFGGTPGYFTLVDENISPLENIEDLVLSPGAPLIQEPEELLSEETRAPATYISILSRISRGKRGMPLTKIKVRRGSPTMYLRTLMMMDIISTLKSLAQGDRIYIINDEFFRFWFKFIYPKQSFLELGRKDLVKKAIITEKNDYLSFTFEKILRELILLSSGKSIKDTEIPFIEDIGAFWWKNIEADACAVAGDMVIIGEAKWRDEKINRREVEKFLAKREIIINKMGKKKAIGIIIAKGGFSNDARKLENTDLILLDLDDLSEHYKRITFSHA